MTENTTRFLSGPLRQAMESAARGDHETAARMMERHKEEAQALVDKPPADDSFVDPGVA